MGSLFSKEERKISKINIKNLYQSGTRIYGEHLIIFWKYIDPSVSKLTQILISVPKKNIKKAVDRNYTKRIIREAYRINKPGITHLLNKPIEVIIKYNKTTVPEFNKLETELLNLLNDDSFK